MAKKKTVRMRPTKVWYVIDYRGRLWQVYVSDTRPKFKHHVEVYNSATGKRYIRKSRVVGPITIREPRPRSSKR